MKKSIQMTCLISVLGLTAPNLSYAIDKWEYKLDLEYGLRIDQFDWNIAGNLAGTGPNIISELQWSNVGFQEARLGFRFIGDKTWYLKGYTTQAWGFQGTNQDSDYNGDDRSLEFSRSTASANRSSAEDFSIAIGRQFRFENRFGITPLMGFSSHRQNFTITNGSQVLCDTSGVPNSCNVGLGPFPGLNSSFTTHFRGPWLGLDLRLAATNRWTTYAEVEYHYSYYNGQGKWNLRDDLQQPISLSQSANGEGIHLGMGMSYALLAPNSFLNIGLIQKKYSTGSGEHNFHLTNGTVASQRLNKVGWSSRSVTIGITTQY